MSVQLPQRDAAALSDLHDRAEMDQLWPVTFRIRKFITTPGTTDAFFTTLFWPGGVYGTLTWTPSYTAALMAVSVSLSIPEAAPALNANIPLAGVALSYAPTLPTTAAVSAVNKYTDQGNVIYFFTRPMFVNNGGTFTRGGVEDFRSFAPHSYYLAANTPFYIFFSRDNTAGYVNYTQYAVCTLHIKFINRNN